MKLLAVILATLLGGFSLLAEEAPSRVLLFFSLNVEADHVLFATQAMQYLAELGDRQGFRVDATSNWLDMNEENLKQYRLVVWLNAIPPAAQQTAFERYMESGGGWLGFHVAAYNDRNSRWTWFRKFIGGGVFGINNWPPLPATLKVDDPASPVTQGVPPSFVAPVNEWYSWRPSPRSDPDIRVLVTLDPVQYPLGIKSLITDRDPDVPVVWTNTRYRMLYFNMGHGEKIFSSSTQNRLFENGISWLLRRQ